MDGFNVSVETGGYTNAAGGYKTDQKQDILSLIGSSFSFGKKYQNYGDVFFSASYHKNKGQLMYIPYFTGSEEGGFADHTDYMETQNILAKYKYRTFQIFGQFTNITNGSPMADYWATAK